MQHDPVNLKGPITPSGHVNIPAQNTTAPPMGILCTPRWIQHAPAEDIQETAPQSAKYVGFQYLDMTRQVPRAVTDLPQICEYFCNNLSVLLFYLLT